jgi:UDP-glucose-4-epimerase GalE
LVTGGAGYIGSHVCKALAEAGAIPVCLDSLERGHRWAVRWGPLEVGDMGDSDLLEEIFTRHAPRAIVHMAGYIEVGESVAQPQRYMHNNVEKTKALIEMASRFEVEAFVFSSSCSVYGLPQADLLSEAHAIAPLSPYAASKASVEDALSETAQAGLRSASLRYFNAAGADSSAEIGEAHQPETHLLPLAIDAALGLGKPLTVLGSDYATPDGSCVRDFVHVTDLAEAHVRALHWLAARDVAGLHEAFNIGSGSGYSVKEVVQEVSRIVGRAVPHEVGPRRPGDSPRLVGDIGKAKRELDWRPTRSLAIQVEDALRWRIKMPR